MALDTHDALVTIIMAIFLMCWIPLLYTIMSFQSAMRGTLQHYANQFNNTIYQENKSALLGGNPLDQATKRHLNNS